MKHGFFLRNSGFTTCLCLAAPSFSQPITFQFPLYQQVFQRDSLDSAVVSLRGIAPAGSDELRARAIVSPAAAAGSSTPWTTVAKGAQVSGGTFKGALKLLKGGWYSIRVEAFANGALVASDSISRVGIGDVFVTAGQSNSANWGFTSKHLSAKSDRVVYYNGATFAHAVDPIPGGFGTGSSPWTPLGDTLTAWTRCPVCFRSATLDATPVDQWLPPGSRQFDTLCRRAGVFGPKGVKAVLWVHGESDALVGTSSKDYCDRLTRVIDSTRERLGSRVDWFVSGTSYHPQATASDIVKVYEGQKLLWQSGTAFEGPYTNDMLGPMYRAADGVHFNEAGLKEMAGRWHAVLTKMYWPAAGAINGSSRKATPRPARWVPRVVLSGSRAAKEAGEIFDIGGRRLKPAGKAFAPGLVIVE